MPLKPGDTLLNGQFKILDQLGRGGYGFVYRACDTYLSEDVAIKELLPSLVADPDVLKRFLAEAKATIRLRHERIVGTRQIFEDGGNYYIVMDYMPGGSLEDRLGQGPLDIQDSIRIATEVCDALDCAHRCGIVHCDLKPANILFTSTGSAKIADFGISFFSQQTLTRSWQTSTGSAFGTLPYMSPEQLSGVRDDPRLDLYALGAVLYEMLTGRPYVDFNPDSTPRAEAENIQRVCNDQPKPPGIYRAGIPPWLEQAVLTALAKASADRYPSAAAFKAALLNAAQTPLRSPLTPALGPKRARAPLPRWVWPAAGLALVVVILGIALALRLGGGQSAKSVPPVTESAVAVASATPSPTAPLSGRIAFSSSRDDSDHAEIYVMNADGSGVTRLTNSPADDNYPAWSPDGRRIAFTSSHDGNIGIYVVNADGTGLTNLTNNPAFDFDPTWSPDGSHIAFTSNRDDNDEIYVVNADGTGLTNLTNNPAFDNEPAWSPDGSRIAFTSHRDGNWEIYVMNADGTGQTRLTYHPARYLELTWSPDGRRIAFESDHDGYFGIYVMNADGTGQTRLTDNSAGEGHPAWSPDGTRIAFHSNRDGNWEIYVVNADGSGQTRLTNNPAEDTRPVWSPDNRGIAFMSVSDDNYEIYVMNADGTNLINLTDNPGHDFGPVWSP